ncbi:MAG: glycosyltransferase family 10, partial [Bacteroidota bacterium]
MEKADFPFELYGRGFRQIDDKFDAIYPFKYSLAIENYACPDYWTEKIADCLLSWTMPVYYGCTNILDYFPKEAMLLIDPAKPAAAMEQIQAAIDEDRWGKSLDAIAEARDLILNKYQLYPNLAAKIKALNPAPDLPKEKVS